MNALLGAIVEAEKHRKWLPNDQTTSWFVLGLYGWKKISQEKKNSTLMPATEDIKHDIEKTFLYLNPTPSQI